MEETLEQSKTEKLFERIADFRGIGKEAKLVREVVPIETWLNEEFYSGPSSSQLYPYWKNAIIKVFNSPKRINEVIITGSIGTGKSTAAKVIPSRCGFPFISINFSANVDFPDAGQP